MALYLSFGIGTAKDAYNFVFNNEFDADGGDPTIAKPGLVRLKIER